MKTTIPLYSVGFIFAIISIIATFLGAPMIFTEGSLAVAAFFYICAQGVEIKNTNRERDDWKLCYAGAERAYETAMSRLEKMHLAAAEECDMAAVDKILANVVIADLETSGLHPSRHGVLSIGGVKAIGSDEFCEETRLGKDRIFEPRALEVNGRTVESLDDPKYSDAREARARFLQWLGTPPNGGRWMLAGENVGKHDWHFLREIRPSPSQPEFDTVIHHRTLDLHTLAVACTLAGIFAMPERGWSADRIFEACGLGAEPKPHGPLTGAQMSAKALRYMARKMAGCAQDLTAKTPRRQGEPCRVPVPTSLDGLPTTLIGVGKFPDESTLIESGRHTPRTGEPKADTLANFQAPEGSQCNNCINEDALPKEQTK